MRPEGSYWERVRRPTVTRRTVLRGATRASAGLATAVLVGCAGGEKPAAGPTGEEVPRSGGTFRHYMANPGHFDIMTSTIVWHYPFAGVVYNKLAKIKPVDLIPMPDLATWEQPDAGTLVFKLPRGVRFHDKPPVNGRELKASDVVFSLDRLRSPDPVFVHRGDYRAIDKVEAPDDVTVRITTKFLDASLLTSIASPQAIMIAPETIERFGDLKTADAQIGTGPFMVRELEVATGGRLPRHPNYYKPGLPYLEAVSVEVMTTTASWNAFLAGRLDLADVAAEEIAGFDPKARGAIAGVTVSRGGGVPLTFYPNLQRKPYDDIRVRRALSLIIDRRETLQNGYPGYPRDMSRPSVALGRDHERFNLSLEETEKLRWGWDPAKKQADIQEGIQLLEAAGITRANPLRVEIIGDDNPGAVHGVITGEYMKGYLEKVTEGRIQFILRYQNVAAWLSRNARGEFDAFFAHFIVGYDVDHALSKIYASDGGRNYGRWRDPEMDRLLEKERSTFDFNQRKAVVNEAQRYIADQVPTIPIGYGAGISVIRDKVRNFIPGQGYEQLEETWFAA